MYNILCSPNISEGRNKEIIETCAAAISSVDGVILLDADPSPTNNRTVFNFVGNPTSVVEAALNLSRASYNLIDMTKHKGYQPRLGVMSACPFIPLKNEDIDRCFEIANEFGIKLAEEVVAPVYIYGDKVVDKTRKSAIEELFMTEYEELEEKIQRDDLKPDFGVTEFVPQWGATLVGARKFLVYFNINLLGTKEQAVFIAKKVEDIFNKKEEDTSEKEERIQCTGWFSDELNVAQVSINVSNFENTPINVIFDEVTNQSKEVSATVIGSQLVGIVPLCLLLQTAEHIIETEKLLIMDDDQRIRLVIGKLGLNSLSHFNPKEKVIEYIVEASEESRGTSSTISLENALLNLTVGDFLQAVSARNSTPGLGSVASLLSTLGASLATMFGLLNYGKCLNDVSSKDDTLRRLIPSIYQINKKLLPYIDKHALLAFEYSKISGMPTETERDKEMKSDMELKSLERCMKCSRELASIISELWPPLIELTSLVDISCCGELKLAASCIVTALEGLLYLVSSYPQNGFEELKTTMETLYSEGKSQRELLDRNVSIEN